MSSSPAGYFWAGACGANLATGIGALAGGAYALAAVCVVLAAGSAVFAVACYRTNKGTHHLARVLRRVK